MPSTPPEKVVTPGTGSSTSVAFGSALAGRGRAGSGGGTVTLVPARSTYMSARSRRSRPVTTTSARAGSLIVSVNVGSKPRTSAGHGGGGAGGGRGGAGGTGGTPGTKV